MAGFTTIIEQLNARGQGFLPGLIGIEFLSVEPGRLTSRLALRPELLALNRYLHAATVIALADTTCGYGTFAALPSGAQNFTTIELKSNFFACLCILPAKGSLPAWEHESTGDARPRYGMPR